MSTKHVVQVITRRFKSNVYAKLKMSDIIAVTDFHAESVAVDMLKSGGVISLPTDTVYGLACCATNKYGIQKLYSIKSRNEDKPIAICVGREEDVKKWAIVSHLPEGLLNSLFPGPVTLILTCAQKLDKSLSFNGKVGIRIPNYEFIKTVCNTLKRPIALTSANVAGEPSSVRIDEFQKLWQKLTGIFDGGVLGVGDSNRGASTIVDLSIPNMYSIVREGIAHNETVQILNKYGLKLNEK